MVLSSYLAFLLRFEGRIPEAHFSLFLSALPVLVAARMAALMLFGLYAGLWRYVSVKDLRNIVGSVALGSLAFLVLERKAPAFAGYPRSVVVIDSLILCFLLSAARLSRRALRGWVSKPRSCRRTLIVGAGDAGESLLREMELHPDYGYVPVGLVDDDPAKRGARIRGVRVLGSRSDLQRIVESTNAGEIVIAIPSAPFERLREIAEDCRKTGLPVKTLPGLADLLLSGKLLDAVVGVEPEDLLCRPPVIGPSPDLEAFYRGKAVLVTGAGGSIGSELSRQLAAFAPSRLVLFERHEFSLYEIDRELRARGGTSGHVSVIGDVCDRARLASVFSRYAPDVVFHAAAYKHVPLMEAHPSEAVKVNVLGTKNVLDLALDFGADRFVFISSDKAVNPVGVMGATKRLGELLLTDRSAAGDGRRRGAGTTALAGGRSSSGGASARTRLIAVRFGNVLESSGSVVPLFKEQIRRGGPVTVTHPEAERYFMTTREAVHLVLHAGMLGRGGEVFVLDMGKPIRLLDMARLLISLYGYEPEKDIPIVFTGLRPGERLKESLFQPEEEVLPTPHPKLRIAVPASSAREPRWGDVLAILGPHLGEALDLDQVSRGVLRIRSPGPTDPASSAANCPRASDAGVAGN